MTTLSVCTAFLATQPGQHPVSDEEVERVLSLLKAWVVRGLDDMQWAALTSLTLDVGAGAVFHSSLLTAIRSGYDSIAVGQFAGFSHAGGRVMPQMLDRREREARAYGACVSHRHLVASAAHSPHGAATATAASERDAEQTLAVVQRDSVITEMDRLDEQALHGIRARDGD